MAKLDGTGDAGFAKVAGFSGGFDGMAASVSRAGWAQ